MLIIPLAFVFLLVKLKELRDVKGLAFQVLGPGERRENECLS